MDYSYIDTYFSEEPVFTDYTSQLKRWLGFVDLLCLTLVARQNSNSAVAGGMAGHRPSAGELVEALLPKKASEDLPRDRIREIYLNLFETGGSFNDSLQEATLWNLVYSGILSAEEIVALFFAVARDWDRKYETAFDVISGTQNEGAATVGLVLDACALFMDEEELKDNRLLNDNSFLYTYLLEKDSDPKNSRIKKHLKIKNYAFEALMGGGKDYSSMRYFAEILPAAGEEETVLRKNTLNRYMDVLKSDSGSVIVLKGEDGSGRRYLVSRASSELGKSILHIRTEVLLTCDNNKLAEILDELCFKYYLYGDIFYFSADDFNRFDEDRLQFVFSKLFLTGAKVIVGSAEIPSNIYLGDNPVTIKLEKIGRTDQIILWQELAKRRGIEFESETDLKELVSKYDLKPGRIASVLDMFEGGNTILRRQIEDEINSQSHVKFGTLAEKISNPFTREDIYLTDIVAKEFDAVINRIRLRSVVNGEFGFGRNLPYGRGVSVVLYGPPGTGKTMLASVIANELNLDLYRIDLSQLSSKYIGETEKNIAELFKAASNSNGILFFDEADALFAKRTNVSGSNDRYANAETAYLLQQIEGYDGLSIMATNAMQNFDSAFKRRMTFIIPVEKPNESERLKLWQNIFPKDTPLNNNIDFELLANKAELTGSAIKAAALDAAYRAAAREDKVGMNDLIEAVEVQARRNGMTGVGNSIRFGT